MKQIINQTSGYIFLRGEAKAEFPVLAQSGGISLGGEAKAEFPVLAQSGDVSLGEEAKAEFPVLAQSGDVFLYKGVKAEFPVLAQSGDIFLYEGAKFIHPCTDGVKYRSVDNSLFVVESEKAVKGIKIQKGYNIEKIVDGLAQKKHCFVVEKDGFTAHGETAREALNDVVFKIASEKLKHEPITADTVITIDRYHAVTGACVMGIKDWMLQNDVTDDLTAKDLLPILKEKNAYGIERFKEIITF